MRAKSPAQITLLLLRASAALAVALAPLQLSLDGAMPKLKAAVALADDDDSDSGGGDSGGSDSGGGGGGSDHDDDDDDDSDDDASDDDDSDDGDDDDDDERVNPATGDRVEIDGNEIKVIHADGTKEEVDDGVYEMKDAKGRTIVERRATQADINRLKDMAG